MWFGQGSGPFCWLAGAWWVWSVEWRLSLSVGDNNLSPVTRRGEGESLSAGPSLPSLPNPRIYPWSPLSGPRTMAMAGLVSVLESWPCVSHITQWHRLYVTFCDTSWHCLCLQLCSKISSHGCKYFDNLTKITPLRCLYFGQRDLT